MADIYWGLLGSESVESTKRTRTLGLGAAVRAFNDLAVPGMGGVWFGKQLFLATLGVVVAERVRAQSKRVDNIRVTNAIEAMGCWLALNEKWEPDPRVRGATKLRDKGKNELGFSVVSKPGFYVSQPMRMATVQALRTLGFVESGGERFNTFTCTPHGHAFTDMVCGDHRSHKNTVKEFLVKWVKGDGRSTNGLKDVLSPKKAMPLEACEFLQERLIAADWDGVGANRRKAAQALVENLRINPNQKFSWDQKPPMLEQTHWKDLQSGGLFFLARDAAITVLDQLELQIGNQTEQRLSLQNPLPEQIQSAIGWLRQKATDFINLNHDSSPGKMATHFAQECMHAKDGEVVTNLVQRDGRVLKWRDPYVLPGMAFIGTDRANQSITIDAQEDGGIEVDTPSNVKWPEGISYRVPNLFLLNLDLHGELDDWLTGSADIRGDA